MVTGSCNVQIIKSGWEITFFVKCSLFKWSNSSDSIIWNVLKLSWSQGFLLKSLSFSPRDNQPGKELWCCICIHWEDKVVWKYSSIPGCSREQIRSWLRRWETARRSSEPRGWTVGLDLEIAASMMVFYICFCHYCFDRDNYLEMRILLIKAIGPMLPEGESTPNTPPHIMPGTIFYVKLYVCIIIITLCLDFTNDSNYEIMIYVHVMMMWRCMQRWWW